MLILHSKKIAYWSNRCSKHSVLVGAQTPITVLGTCLHQFQSGVTVACKIVGTLLETAARQVNVSPKFHKTLYTRKNPTSCQQDVLGRLLHKFGTVNNVVLVLLINLSSGYSRTDCSQLVMLTTY